MEEHYRQLIGFHIVGFRFERDEYGDDEGWPIYMLKNDKGEEIDLVISRDPEGNGGGFAFIE
jgi:hypothetical protein